MIFGDLLHISHIENNWLLIKTLHDNYEGWVDIKQIRIINHDKFYELKNNQSVYLTGICGKATSESGKIINLVSGSRLHNYKNNSTEISHVRYVVTGEVQSNISERKAENIVRICMGYLGAPYLWGGRSPYGIDCSGFTQIVFKIDGIDIGRDAYLQSELGETISFINEIKIGDLAFFDNEEENITHVGIILDNNHIIHASGEVRIDNIDHHGIYNEELKKYTHKLRIIKRII